MIPAVLLLSYGYVTSRLNTIIIWPVPGANDQVAHKTHTTLDLRMNLEGT